MYEGESRLAELPIPVGPRYHADVTWPELDMERARKLTAQLKADGMSGTLTATCTTPRPSAPSFTELRRQAKAFGLTIETELMDAGPFVNLVLGPDRGFAAGCFKVPYSSTPTGSTSSSTATGTPR